MAKKIKYIGNEPVNKYSLPSFSTFNDSYSTTIFNGGIQLSTSFSIAQTTNRDKKLLITQKNVSLTDLKIYNINELNNYIKIANKLKLNIDKTNLSSHAVYGSLKEKFRITINNIINKFPGGLYINDFVSGITYFNILDYTYDDKTNISSFRIPINVIENPFFLNLFSNTLIDSRDLNNIPVRYEDYVLTYNDIIYGINGFTGLSKSNSSYLYLLINGDPFSGNTTPQNFSEKFLITPNEIEFNKFYDSLNELERYFLNKNSTPKYTFEFKIPEVNEDDELEFIDYSLTFPLRYDGYNLDTISIRYIDFLDKVFDIANIYDEYKSNLIIRKFTPNSLIDFDGTDVFKSESILKIYGNQIDEIKMFFDSLMHINTVSYDKINNIPDTLIKNLARTLSWKAQNIISDKDLVKSIFESDTTNDTDISASLAEIDIELWRRIVINTAWFLKSKGTRSAIETIFSFIGAPESLINLTEHVYVVDAPIGKTFSITEAENESGLIVKPPYDENGYPAAPSSYALQYFQINGNEDFGQAYIDLFRNEGFNVTKIIDNKKSWTYVESATTYSSLNRNTRYNSDDSRLIINTKEIEVSIDIARAIEYDVYQFNVQYNYPVIDTGSTIPYPQRESNNFHASGLTFAEYIDRVYSAFINAQNRKVSDSAIGSYYPSLTKLYYDYLESPLSTNKKRYRELYDFVSNIDAIFSVFVKQFIPATSIYDGGGLRIRNTQFTPQKYVYKQGIDDGSEFEGDVKESESLQQQNIIIIETEFFDTYEDSLKVATITTEVKSDDSGNIDTDPFAYAQQKINVQPTWDAVVCDNETPNFIMTGGTKIELSSLTNNSLYNKETGTGHTTTFNFTSGTQTLSADTTIFYFNLHKYNYDVLVDGFDDAPVYTFSSSSTAFTSTTQITTLISDSLLNCDTEYIIKPFFTYDVCPQEGQLFTAKTPYTMYENFILNEYYDGYNTNQTERLFDPSKFSLSTGSTVSSLVSRTNYSPLFRNYNTLSDYYFVSTCDAQKPLFNFPVSVETDGLTVETIPVNDTGFTKFNLLHEPVGDIVVAANGVTLLEGLEYSADTSITIPSIQVRSFVLSEPLTSDYNDVLTVAYYKNNANNQKLIKENFEYSGSPNISISGSNYVVDLTYTRALNNSDVVVYINGIMLTNGPDYTISVFDSNQIILNSAITLLDGDVVSVVYFTFSTGTDAINLSGTSYVITWITNSLIPTNVTGNFTHEFYELSNTGLTGNTVYSAITDYLYNTYNFQQMFTWSSTPLTAGETYFYRIKSEKYFTTINNISFTSTTYSDTLKVKLPV